MYFLLVLPVIIASLSGLIVLIAFQESHAPLRSTPQSCNLAVNIYLRCTRWKLDGANNESHDELHVLNICAAGIISQTKLLAENLIVYFAVVYYLVGL